MQILLLPNSYPPRLGGLETVAHTLARHLVSSGHQVQVVTQRYPRSLPARDVIDGVPVQRWLLLELDLGNLRRGRADLFLASLLAAPLARWRLARLTASFQPSVVNVHFPDHQTPLVLWLRRRRSFRLVVSLHGDELLRWIRQDTGQRTKDRAFQRLQTILRQADAVTACSRYLLDQAIGLEPAVTAKGQVIHNGIDLVRFQDRTIFRHPRPYLLAFGRLSRVKGFDLLLEAWARLAADYLDLDLLIAGDGEECAALRSQAECLGLAGRVCFTGRLDPEGVVHLLNGSEFVVVPSRNETFGISALEAMAAGKPLVATQVGGVPEFITGPANQLVPATVEGLVQGLNTLLAQPPAVLAQWGRINRSTAAAFAWERVADSYLQILTPPELVRHVEPGGSDLPC